MAEVGVFLLLDSGWKQVDENENGKTVREGPAPRRDSDHIFNFIETIRGNARFNSEIEESQKSTPACQLGNMV